MSPNEPDRCRWEVRITGRRRKRLFWADKRLFAIGLGRWLNVIFMRFRNVIFDFDRTLVDLGPHVDWKSAVTEIEGIYLSEGIPPEMVEQNKGFGFRLMRTAYDHMLVAFTPERLREVQGRIFSALELHELRGVGRASLMAGAQEALSWLRSHACRCAIVTSNGTRVAERTLQRLGMSSSFAGIFGRDVSCRLKPYPDQNQLCLRSLGWHAEETTLVGDSPEDILSAKPLSIFTVGVLSGRAKQDKLSEAGADQIIAGLAQLPSALQTA